MWASFFSFSSLDSPKILECKIESYLMLALTLKIDLKLMRSCRELFFLWFVCLSFLYEFFSLSPAAHTHLPIETEWKMLVDFLEAWNTSIHSKIWAQRIYFLTGRCIKYVSFLTLTLTHSLNVCVCVRPWARNERACLCFDLFELHPISASATICN